MRLLYCYTEFLDAQGNPRAFRNLEKIELNLSTEERFSFNKETNTLRRVPRTTPLPKEFWTNDVAKAVTNQSSNLYNVNVIAGQNGSGKSTMIHYIIDLLDATHGMIKNHMPKSKRHDPRMHRNILLFEGVAHSSNDTEGVEWFLMDYAPLSTGITEAVRLEGFSEDSPQTTRFFFHKWLVPFNNTDDNSEREHAKAGITRLLKGTKVIYMTNTLNKRDYELHQYDDPKRVDYRKLFVYDCAIGAMLRSNVSQFFANEIYKQVKYVFDSNQYKLRVALDVALNMKQENNPKINSHQTLMPKTLTLLPRIDTYHNMFYEKNISVYRQFLDKWASGQTPASDLTQLLGVLCVGAFITNISKICELNEDKSEKDFFNKMSNCESPLDFDYMKETIDKYSCFSACMFKGPYEDKLYLFGRKGIDGEVQKLTNYCFKYIDFLSDHKGDLFCSFSKLSDGKSYVLPLDLAKDEGLFPVLIQFIQKYRYTCEPNYTIDFDWGLSSGEENMLRLFSNLYFIFDRDYSSGRYGDYMIYNDDQDECDSVLIFMDEADLTMHPEWQRTMIYILTAYLPSIYPLPNTRDMQLILSTHSPLLLGDIPTENVTYLENGRPINGGDNKSDSILGGTFGQNIHTILKESFFLGNGTVGEFAARKINATAKRLKQLSNGYKPKTGELDTLRQMVALVAPSILRAQLDQLLRDAELQTTYDADQAKRLFSQFCMLSPEDQKRFMNMERGSSND